MKPACARRAAGPAAAAGAPLLRGLLGAALLAAAVTPVTLHAQVVREEGVKSIAGVLSSLPGGARSAEWTFRSAGGEVLFATLDADIYRRMVEHDPHVTSAAVDGCSDDEGGPGLFRLEVLDRYDQVVCMAERPAPPPGWQRDPRLACVMPAANAPLTYRVRVALIVSTDHAMAPEYPFLLNLSLRRIARSGTTVQAAVATSQATPF